MITSFTLETEYPELALMAGHVKKFDRPEQAEKGMHIPDQAKQRLETLEAELDARNKLLNDSALISITDLSGTIIYANDMFCRVTGYERNRVIGFTHTIIRHSEMSDETIASIWNKIREGKTWSGEVKNSTKDGNTLWAEAIIAPVLDENGKPVRYIWVQHDITEKKRTANLLLNAKQSADQQLIDNVCYASTIQKALLPSEKDLKSVFPESFLMYEAKHIVSGDFYWFTKVQDDSVMVLGDGTGHGVSAAFVSLMALTGLKYAVDEMHLTEPGMVLSQLNSFLFRAMNKNSGSGLTESVDMSFCRYNHKTRILRYACGRSKIYVLRGNTIQTLCRGEGPSHSVSTDQRNILSYSVHLKKGDRVYMMSDGLADQFGSDKDKRLGSKRMRELLEKTSTLGMEKQQEEIREYLKSWRGANEQTDDISLIGFEIN